jgi:hypothetical protein
LIGNLPHDSIKPEAHSISLDAYVPLLGAPEIDELRVLAAQLSGRTVQMVNSTAMGGGDPESFHSIDAGTWTSSALGCHHRRGGFLRSYQGLP